MPEETKVVASAHRASEEAVQGAAPSHTDAAQNLPQNRQPVAGISDEQRRMTSFRRLALILVAGAIISIVLYVLFYVQTGAWQILTEVGFLVLSLVSAAVGYHLARQGKLDAAGYWAIFGLVVAYGGAELIWSGATLYLTVGGILLIILTGSMIMPRKWVSWLVIASLFGIYVWLVNQFEPLPRYDIAQSILLGTIIPGITGLAALAVLWQIARAFRLGTIRTRLLIAFVTMVLLPAAVTGAGSAVLGWRSGRQQAINQLESVATLKEAEIETWVSSLQTNLVTALTGEEAMPRTIMLLQLPEPSEYLAYRVRSHFQQAIEQAGRFEELFLMNLQGQVVLSTDAEREGEIYSDQTYFQEGVKGPYVQPPFYSSSLDRMSVVVVRPVADEEGRVWGVLAGRAGLAKLNEIMGERAGLGQTGETYIIGRDRALLTELRSGEEGIYVRTQGADAAIENRISGSGLYDDYRGVPVIGVYHWLPELQVVLLAEQSQAEAFGATYATLVINVGVALVSVILAVVASLFITRSIATPLGDLAETATQIAAGDLERIAKVEREDEVGTLGRAFNSMTAQLRGLIGSLEQRVARRTRELEQRSAYLEASAAVGRAASSILDADQLIRQVVELIRERFGLYYVGLFLVDEAGEWAVLRAGTGDAGRAMLARGHRIKAGEGMIGWSIANAQARVALDVGEDAVRLATAELPDTRSEVALPLRSRGRVIGALTVQSDQPSAFDEAAVAVLQTLADQVAVALDNARLFTETQAALEATRRAYSELSREAWAGLLRTQSDLSYRSDERGVTSAGDIWRPEMERALEEGKTVQIPDSKSQTPNPLAVPIKVRGNVIGILDTYKTGDAGGWTAEEVAVLETLADQLGETLESARLYEDAQRRAVRERLTREITDKMRRASGVEGIVQAAVDELFGVLGTSRAFVRLEAAPSAQDDEKDGA
ncbi:MAG: GAF domain-containing protein [Anaerolineae bacterium]